MIEVIQQCLPVTAGINAVSIYYKVAACRCCLSPVERGAVVHANMQTCLVQNAMVVEHETKDKLEKCAISYKHKGCLYRESAFFLKYCTKLPGCCERKVRCAILC